MIHAGVVVGSVCRVPNAACSDREPWPKRGSEGCRTASAEARGGGVASPGGASSAGAEGPTGAGRTYPDAAKGTRSGEGRGSGDGLEHPEQRRAGSCTAVHRSVVARVLPCPGDDDVGV